MKPEIASDHDRRHQPRLNPNNFRDNSELLKERKAKSFEAPKFIN